MLVGSDLRQAAAWHLSLLLGEGEIDLPLLPDEDVEEVEEGHPFTIPARATPPDP